MFCTYVPPTSYLDLTETETIELVIVFSIILSITMTLWLFTALWKLDILKHKLLNPNQED